MQQQVLLLLQVAVPLLMHTTFRGTVLFVMS
jgi:hypothetical protein